MYARRYYLIYRRNLLPEYSRTSQQQYSRASQQQYSRASQQPIVFLCKVTFDLLTFLPFAAYSSNSPRSPFTSFTIHFFTFTFSPFSLHFLSFSFPFPLLSPSPFIPLYLTTSGTKTEKIRDNSFISRKNVLTLQP